MPLSKKRNADRMKEFRLHGKKHTEVVQPKETFRPYSKNTQVGKKCQ